jgi:hypothetical protein
MKVYKKSNESFDFIFTIKPYYIQQLEYVKNQRSLYNNKKCREREFEEIQRQKQRIYDKQRLKIYWNMKGYKFNYITHEIIKMTEQEQIKYLECRKYITGEQKRIEDSMKWTDF